MGLLWAFHKTYFYRKINYTLMVLRNLHHNSNLGFHVAVKKLIYEIPRKFGIDVNDD
jgi:hypothetical protein